jgi:hypothetical protein
VLVSVAIIAERIIPRVNFDFVHHRNEEVYRDQTSPLNLLQICFQALSVFCANSKIEPQCKVIAFDGVTSWLQRIKNLLKKDSSESTGEAITLVMTEKVREMLVMYVWSHWDDPVDAVQHKASALVIGKSNI